MRTLVQNCHLLTSNVHSKKDRKFTHWILPDSNPQTKSTMLPNTNCRYKLQIQAADTNYRYKAADTNCTSTNTNCKYKLLEYSHTNYSRSITYYLQKILIRNHHYQPHFGTWHRTLIRKTSTLQHPKPKHRTLQEVNATIISWQKIDLKKVAHFREIRVPKCIHQFIQSDKKRLHQNIFSTSKKKKDKISFHKKLATEDKSTMQGIQNNHPERI